MKAKQILLILMILISLFYFPKGESIGVHEETTGYTYGSIENDTHTSITEHKFYVYNDSYVWDGIFAGSNFGTSNDVHVSYIVADDTWKRRGYFIGNLSSIPSENTTITDAYLYIRSTDYTGFTDDDQYCYRVTGNWNENTITWNNQPAVAGSYTDKIDYLNFGYWRYWNVTPDVQGFINGTYTNYGWRIRTSEGGGISDVSPIYDSRETSYDPYVSVFYETRFNVSRTITADSEYDNLSFVSDQVWVDNVVLKVPVSDNVTSIHSVTNNTAGVTAVEVSSKAELTNNTYWFDSANHFVYIGTVNLSIGLAVNWTVLSTPPWHFYIQIPQYKEVGDDIIMSGRITNVTDNMTNITAETHVYYQNGTDALTPVHYWWCEYGNYFCSIATSSLPPGIYLISIEITDPTTGFVHKKGATLYLSWEASGGVYNNAIVYINWYNTNIGLGLPDETLKLYVDGEYKNNNIVYTYIGAELDIIVQDYYDLEMYNGTFNVTKQFDEINLGLTFHEYYFTNTNNEYYYASLLKDGATRWFELVVPSNLGSARFMLPSGNYTARVYNADNSSYVSWDETVNRSRAYQIGNNGVSLIIQGQSVIRGQLLEFKRDLDYALMPDATIYSHNPPIIFSCFDRIGMMLGQDIWWVCPAVNVIAETRNSTYGNWINSSPLIPTNGSIENGTITVLEDTLYIHGNATWVNITYTENGTVMQNTTYVPGMLPIFGDNLTINASDDVHVLRITIYNQLKKFEWAIYNSTINPGHISGRAGYHEASIEVENTLDTILYNVYVLVGFSDMTTPDVNTVRVQDVDNDGAILERGENFKTTADAIEFRVTGSINASGNTESTRNFICSYYRSFADSYIYDNDEYYVQYFEKNKVYSGKKPFYNYFEVHYHNSRSLTFKGGIYVVLDLKTLTTEIDKDNIIVEDLDNNVEVERSNYIPGESFIFITSGAVGDVSPGGIRNFGIYFLEEEHPGSNPEEIKLNTNLGIFLGIPWTPFLMIFIICVAAMAMGIFGIIFREQERKWFIFMTALSFVILFVFWILAAKGG